MESVSTGIGESWRALLGPTNARRTKSIYIQGVTNSWISWLLRSVRALSLKSAIEQGRVRQRDAIRNHLNPVDGPGLTSELPPAWRMVKGWKRSRGDRRTRRDQTFSPATRKLSRTSLRFNWRFVWDAKDLDPVIAR